MLLRTRAVTMANLSSIVIICVYFICQQPLMTGHLVDGVQVEFKQFYDFMVEFGKSYNDAAEQATRFEIFKSNLEIIQQLNSNKQDSAEYGVTVFSDLTAEEFKRRFMVPTTNESYPAFRESIPASILSFRLEPRTTGSTSSPKNRKDFFSWVDKNRYYPPVEDLSQIEYLNVYAMVEVISILYSSQQAKAINLSKQQYVDCGGIIIQKNGPVREETIFEYLNENYLAVEDDYPLKKNGAKGRCDQDAVAKGVAGVSEHWSPTTEKGVKESLRKSPIVSTVYAEKIQHYKSGIITECPGVGDSELSVVIVEHGVDVDQEGRDLPYYLLRTNWGRRYGIKEGHVKIKRGICGLERTTYAVKIKSRKSCLSAICNRLKITS